MSDYTAILTRLRASLVDADGAIWGAAELDEALLQSLADMRQAAAVEYSVNGLAGAVETTLPAAWFDALVRGAVGYVLLWRAAERVDAFNNPAGLPDAALTTAAAVMKRFEAALAGLAAQRTTSMQTSTAAPYPDGTDDTQPGWKLTGDLEARGGEIMKALYLAAENGQDAYYLHGPYAQATVRNIHRQPAPNPLPDGRFEEVITIECRGGDIWNLITELEKRLALLADGIVPQYLWLESQTRLSPVRSQIHQGRIELLGNGMADRARGYQGLRLYLTRSGWFEEVLSPVFLNNPNDSNNITGITVYNHNDGDAGHVNYFDVTAAEIRGSQPVPARLMLKAGDAPVRRLGKIIISGGINLWDDTGSFDHVLECESAAAGPGCTGAVNVADGSASGGYYQSLQWTSEDEVHLCSWTLSGERLAWLAGRGLRPAARFHTLPPAGARWRWKITQPGSTAVMDRSPQILLDETSRLQALPPLFPPVQSPSGPFQAFTLEAWLECSSAGVKQLDLDFVHLLPQENYCSFTPVNGLTQGQDLVVNWHSGEIYAQDSASGEKTVSHIDSGAPLVLRPGCCHRVYLLYETDTDFLISDTSSLLLQAGWRWLEP